MTKVPFSCADIVAGQRKDEGWIMSLLPSTCDVLIARSSPSDFDLMKSANSLFFYYYYILYKNCFIVAAAELQLQLARDDSCHFVEFTTDHICCCSRLDINSLSSAAAFIESVICAPLWTILKWKLIYRPPKPILCQNIHCKYVKLCTNEL